MSPPQLPDSAGAAIATLLASACPLIRNFGAGGGVGLAGCKVFGNLCPLMDRWELLDSGTTEATLRSIIRENVFSHARHHKVFSTNGQESSGRRKRFVGLICESTTITHLHFPNHIFGEETWLMLSPSLECLHIPALGSYYALPKEGNLLLKNLKRVIIDSVKVNMVDLAAILAAAPLLMSVRSEAENDVVLDGRATAVKQRRACHLSLSGASLSEIRCADLLSQRLHNGLVLDGLHVCLNVPVKRTFYHHVHDLIGDLHVREVLPMLPPLPGFSSCQISDFFGHCYSDSPQTFESTSREPSDDDIEETFDRSPERPAGSLSHLARILPDAEDIRMKWECDWDEAESELSQLSVGKLVTFFSWQGLHSLQDASLAALAKLTASIPSLCELVHDVEAWDLRPADLHATLHTARGDASGSGGVGVHDRIARYSALKLSHESNLTN